MANDATASTTFLSRAAAEVAVAALKQQGFPPDRISVVYQDTVEDPVERDMESWGTGHPTERTLLGGLAGGLVVLAGAGTMAAAGPLLLALITAGALGGALMAHGLPEDQAREHADGVEQGHVLVMVHGDPQAIQRAAETLRELSETPVVTTGL